MCAVPSISGMSRTPRSGFSSREIEVLELASQGMTNPQIAKRLELSVHAIKFHLASIYRKLGVSNRTEAAVVFLRSQNGRLTVPEAD